MAISISFSITSSSASDTYQMLTNKDFFDKPIRNEHAPAVQQLKQLMDFAASQFLPISTRTARKEQGLENKAEGFLGITRARKRVIQGTPFRH